MDLDTSNFNVVRCHRLYKPKHSVRSGPRDVHLIVRFTSQRTKSYILSATGKLKDRPQPLHMYINEQYPREIEQRRRILRPALKAAKAKKLKASMVMDKLIIKGKTYTVDNLGDIPLPNLWEQLTPRTIYYFTVDTLRTATSNPRQICFTMTPMSHIAQVNSFTNA